MCHAPLRGRRGFGCLCYLWGKRLVERAPQIARKAPRKGVHARRIAPAIRGSTGEAKDALALSRADGTWRERVMHTTIVTNITEGPSSWSGKLENSQQCVQGITIVLCPRQGHTLKLKRPDRSSEPTGDVRGQGWWAEMGVRNSGIGSALSRAGGKVSAPFRGNKQSSEVVASRRAGLSTFWGSLAGFHARSPLVARACAAPGRVARWCAPCLQRPAAIGHVFMHPRSRSYGHLARV